MGSQLKHPSQNEIKYNAVNVTKLLLLLCFLYLIIYEQPVNDIISDGAVFLQLIAALKQHCWGLFIIIIHFKLFGCNKQTLTVSVVI